MKRRGTDSLSRQVALGLITGRVAIGAAALLATRPALRGLGFDPESSSARVLGRMAGGRDLALAGLLVAALDDRRALRQSTWSACAVDAVDAAIFLAAGRHPEMRRAAALSAPFAAAAAVSEAWLARRLA